MINITDKSKCCGCGACANACPKQAIEMVEDKCGFKYPQINKELCVECGLCEKVCPYNKEYTDKKLLDKTIAYGGWIKDNNVKNTSTSGGIFTAIAKYIFEKNGVVCGAIYDDSLNVVHTIVDNEEDLKKINGSKYVQSDMQDCFKKIRKYLNEGRYVLFSGTPCQVSGLNAYLGKEYDNLYTLDIVCHGVPSPKVFEKYKEELEKENNSKITAINFRDKVSGWQGYSFSASFENGKKYTINSGANPYMKAFLHDIDLRESCPTCKFAKLPRYADFTLGDFWGVDSCYPELNKDNTGTSLVLVHTEKGNELLNAISEDVFLKQCDLNKAIKGNPSILKHLPPHTCREKFFDQIEEKSITEATNEYIKNPNVLNKIINKCKKIVKKVIKR